MGLSVVIYTEYVNASLLEELLFSLSKQVRTSRDGKVWEFVINNDLYNLKIEDASVEKMREALQEKEVTETGSFYALSLSTHAKEAENQLQMDQLVHLIETILPVYAVART